MNAKTEKKFKDLARFMQANHIISEFEGNKERFASLSKSFLRALAEDLKMACGVTDQKNVKVSFNRGGPAVAGDPALYIMGENQGAAVYVTDTGGGKILFRSIRAMNDYAGGNNQWANFNDGFERLYENIKELVSRA